MANRELAKRVKTAVVLIVPLTLLLLSAVTMPLSRLALLAIGFIALGFAAFEFARVCGAGHGLARQGMYFLNCIVTPTLILFLGFIKSGEQYNEQLYSLLAIFTGICFSFLFFVVSMFVFGRDTAISARQIAQDMPVGIFLIGLCGSCLIALPLSSIGVTSLAWLIVVVMANDIGAYFVGKAVGGVKLAPYLSPKKTVSGSCGGLIAGVLLGGGLSMLLPEAQEIFIGMLLAVVVGIAAQGGDLIKSYVKRLHDVKDMGTILPGHGGVLDRIDGMLAAASFVYLILLYGSF